LPACSASAIEKEQGNVTGTDDLALAKSLYGGVANDRYRAVLDYLIDHPDERTVGSAIADALGIADHKDVGRAIYAYGEIARELGRERPWEEAQQGYLLSASWSELFKQAR
jgi:hypothetical protein